MSCYPKKRQYCDWSIERVNLLIELRLAGVEWAEIKAAINKLPVTKMLSTQAARSKFALALDNSAGQMRVGGAVVSGGLSPTLQVPSAFFSAIGYSTVTYEYAKGWARRNGLCHKNNALNLIEVNAFRRRLGCSQFVIEGAL